MFVGGENHHFPFVQRKLEDYPLGGASCKVFRHGIQVLQNSRFRAYDEGVEGNRKRYGTDIPPDFMVSLSRNTVTKQKNAIWKRGIETGKRK